MKERFADVEIELIELDEDIIATSDDLCRTELGPYCPQDQ